MFRVIIATFFTVSCYGVPYDGFTLGQLDSGGYGAEHGAHVNAAILSHRSINIIPVPNHYNSAPTVIDIDSSEQPLHLNFKSRSSHLLTTQGHYGQPGSIQETSSHDQPHILRHQVTRPIIQEIREVIIPKRNILQEIRPVFENVEIRVAKGVGKSPGLVGNFPEHLGFNGGLNLGGALGSLGLNLSGKGLLHKMLKTY